MLLAITGALLFIIAFLAACYRKVSPGETHIIYGLGKGIRLVSGPGGYFYFPLLQNYKSLSREPFSCKFEAPEVIISKGINVEVEGTVRLKLRDDESSLRRASETFLNKNQREKVQYIQTIIDDACRHTLKGIDPSRLLEDCNGCAAEVKERASLEMEKAGYELQSLVFSEIKDRIGYLSALGRRTSAEEKARLAIEEAYINREGKTISMMIKRDAQLKRIGMTLEENRDRQLDMGKVMQSTEHYLKSIKSRLDKGVNGLSKSLYGKETPSEESKNATESEHEPQ
jgi:flotillin